MVQLSVVKRTRSSLSVTLVSNGGMTLTRVLNFCFFQEPLLVSEVVGSGTVYSVWPDRSSPPLAAVVSTSTKDEQ